MKAAMRRLNLPAFKVPATSKRKWLSMNEYLQLVNFNLKYTTNRKAARLWKKMFFVNTPFFVR